MSKTPLRSHDVREQNEKLVLRIIHERNGISQSQVSSLTGLRPPTVLRIFTSLISQGFIVGCEGEQEPNEKKGRKPTFFRTNPDSLYAIGLDFWWQSAAVCMIDLSGRAVYKNIARFEDNLDAAEMMSRLEDLLRDAIRNSGVHEQKIAGIGIGAPGVVDIEQGRILKYARAKGMTSFDLKKRIGGSFKLPVYVHNNCSVIALSEYRYGKGKGHGSILAFLIRAGVGGAFIQDGRIFVNQKKTALEVGHLSVDTNGRLCECGARGCLETYLSESAILKELETANLTPTWQNLEKGLEGKEPAFLAVMDRLGSLLSTAACSLINVLNPETILIVSRFKFLSDSVAGAIRCNLDKMSVNHQMSSVSLIPQEYNQAIACRGAADLVFDRFFTAG